MNDLGRVLVGDDMRVLSHELDGFLEEEVTPAE
jgi:hypothetical protein